MWVQRGNNEDSVHAQTTHTPTHSPHIHTIATVCVLTASLSMSIKYNNNDKIVKKTRTFTELISVIWHQGQYSNFVFFFYQGVYDLQVLYTASPVGQKINVMGV